MRTKKSKMSSVYIFPVLFFIICSSYLIRFLFFNIETEIVKYNSIENTIRTKALIVRNESTVALPAGVEISYKVNEGDKVSFGKKILEIVKGNKADDDIAIKIQQLDQRIKEVKQSDINNNFFSQDKEKIESQINEKVAELKNIAKTGDYEKLDTVKDDLTANLYKKSLVYGSGSFFGKNLEQLEKEKLTLEGIYNNSIDDIYAPISGVVSYSIDGYEQILSPLNIKAFKLGSIKEIFETLDEKKQDEAEAASIGIKLVDNFEWYTCSMISEEQARGMKIGKKIKLRFTEFENTQINGEVYEVSQPEGGTCLVIMKITEHINGFYKKRLVEMDIIEDYNEGFTVPKKAIVVKDNIKGVYVIKSGMVKFVPVAVMVEDVETCLVRNLSKEDSDYKSGYDSLKIFDEVITTTKRVKENQVLTDKI
ncbi:MAG TPA: HlyD family efflux transporter periplasmic adaptor subunit [Clostridia bacterium]|nr:HlyD family efflux transporter periplasmic adaptor subunit [Clostridia bacterium]